MAAAGIVPQDATSRPITHDPAVSPAPELSEKLSDSPLPPHTSTPRRSSNANSFATTLTSSTRLSQICAVPRAPTAAVFRTLIYLTFVNPFFSLAAALYTILVLLLCLVTSPLHPSSTIHRWLLPALQVHVRFLSEHPESEPEVTPEETLAPRLVLMHLAAPLMSIPTALVAAVVTLVWFYTEVLLGDESQGSGVEYRSFVAIRGWWERVVFWPTVGVPAPPPDMQQV